MSDKFPFAAIVGQDLLRTALLLVGMNPSIGGVLIRGDKGTAKTTAARGLGDLLSPIEIVPGCAFHCQPGQPLAICHHCQDGAKAEWRPVPFVNLPLGATEDRVTGTLDIEVALQEKRKGFQPGLLASAHRGILYIDEVNLLADHLVDLLLDAAATGENIVQREGLSLSHPARFSLIGTMNPEEGDLRPQLLDRFGIMVDVRAPNDPATRVKIVRNRLAFECDSHQFINHYTAEQARLREQVRRGAMLLPGVYTDDRLIELISVTCCEFKVTSLRADIVMAKVVASLAALDGRTRSTVEDVKVAATLVLPHRKRTSPIDKQGSIDDKLNELIDNFEKDTQKQDRHSSSLSAGAKDSHSGDSLDRDQTDGSKDAANKPGEQNEKENEEDLAAAGINFKTDTAKRWQAQISLRTTFAQERPGRRSLKLGARRGRYLRAVLDDQPDSLALAATMRHAVFNNPGQEFRISRQNLHNKISASRTANLIVLVIDASGSMAARRRMEAVKGSVIALLTDAYQKRDHVCVIAFRGMEAQIILPPTRHTALAHEKLSSIEVGGRTPLASALEQARKMVRVAALQADLEPLLVVLSDGKANIALTPDGDAWHDSLSLARAIADDNISALVIDTEDSYVRMGRAGELAAAMRCEVLTLDVLSTESLTLTIRKRLRAGV